MSDFTPQNAPAFVTNDDQLARWNDAVLLSRAITQGAPDLVLAQAFYRHPGFNVQEAEWDESEHHRIPKGLPHAGEFTPGPFGDNEHFLNNVKHIVLAPSTVTPTVPRVPEFLDWPEKGPVAKQILGDAVNTSELYRLTKLPITAQEENYTPSRMDEQDKWINEKLNDHQPRQHPEALVLAGGTASGKTTFLRHFRDLIAPDDAVHMDPDDAKEHLPEYQSLIEAHDRYAAFSVHTESGDMLHRLTDRVLKTRRNLVLDTTGNRDPGEFREQLKQLIDAGYKVRVVYVNTPTETAVNANIVRSMRSYRHVPTQIVRAIHQRVSARFNEIRDLPGVASVSVIDRDNGLIWHKNEGEEPIVPDANAFGQFLEKAHEPELPLTHSVTVTEALDASGPWDHWVIEPPPHDVSEFMNADRLRARMAAMVSSPQ